MESRPQESGQLSCDRHHHFARGLVLLHEASEPPAQSLLRPCPRSQSPGPVVRRVAASGRRRYSPLVPRRFHEQPADERVARRAGGVRGAPRASRDGADAAGRSRHARDDQLARSSLGPPRCANLRRPRGSASAVQGPIAGIPLNPDPVNTAYRLPAGEVSPSRYARALCRQVRNCFIAAALHLKPLLDGR